MQWYKSTDNNIYNNNNFYPNSISQNEGIDFRNELHTILYGSQTYPFQSPKGHWIVYRRYNRCAPSVYYSKRSHEGIGGPAYEYTDTLYRTRRVPLDKNGLPVNDIKLGTEISDRYHYYFEYTVNPTIGDHIFEINLSDHTQTPNINNITYSYKYLIKKIHDYRLNNGNVQYYIANGDYDEVSY